MRKMLLTIAINFAVLCALIVCFELLGQLVYVAKNGSILLLSDPDNTHHTDIFERHPYLVGRLKASAATMENNKKITTTDQRTRWTGSPKDDQGLVRIAVLGGSTAFGTGVSDEDSWPAILQTILGEEFAVTNYAVPGFSTVEAIIQLALIVPEKQPHIVLKYMGWNDIRNYHEEDLEPDYFKHGMEQYQNIGINIISSQSKIQALENTFATIWLMGRIKRRMVGTVENDMQLFTEPDPFVDRLYVRNLRTLRVLAKNSHSLSVYIPQVLNYADYRGKKQSRIWTKHIKDDALPELMDRFNALMIEACSEQDRQCIVLSEVANADWQRRDFVDDGHFSRKGGVKFANMIANTIRNVPHR